MTNEVRRMMLAAAQSMEGPEVRSRSYEGIILFLAGAVIGAAIALILA